MNSNPNKPGLRLTFTCLALAGLFGLAQPLEAMLQDPPRPSRGRRGQGRQRPQSQPVAATVKKKKAKPKTKPIALIGATVHIGDARKLKRATVLIQDGKIIGVGSNIEIPKDAKKIDVSGKHISPGFIILAGSGMGIRRGPAKGKWADSIDPFDASIKRGLAVGITAYLNNSSRGGSTPDGNSAVIKLIPEELDGAILKEAVLYNMSVPLKPSGWRKFEESVEKARKFIEERKDYQKKKASGDTKVKAPKPDKKLEKIIKILEGDAKLRISASSSGRRGRFGGGGRGMNKKTIREALKIAKLLGTGVILENPYEGWALADEIAATGSSAIMYPRSEVAADPTREDDNGSRIEACAILSKAGIPLHVLPPRGSFGAGPVLGSGGILGRDLNTPFLDACFAIRGGMDRREGLATITLYPAQMLGVDDRIGSIEEGKDADLLILDGDPLHYRSLVLQVYVNGKLRYDKDKDLLYPGLRSQSK